MSLLLLTAADCLENSCTEVGRSMVSLGGEVEVGFLNGARIQRAANKENKTNYCPYMLQ